MQGLRSGPQAPSRERGLAKLPLQMPAALRKSVWSWLAYNTILRPRSSGFSCHAEPRPGPHRSSSTDEEKSKVVALHLKPSGFPPPTMKSRDEKSILRLLKSHFSNKVNTWQLLKNHFTTQMTYQNQGGLVVFKKYRGGKISSDITARLLSERSLAANRPPSRRRTGKVARRTLLAGS